MMPSTVFPHNNDILFGRGTIIQNHHGNKQFRSMVDARKPEFVQTLRKKEKRVVALKIIQDISSLEPPGRFLMEIKGVAPSTSSANGSISSDNGVDPSILSKVWVVVDQDTAVAKVMHRLREKDPEGYANHPSNEKEVKRGEENLELQPQPPEPGLKYGTNAVLPNTLDAPNVRGGQQKSVDGPNASQHCSLDKEVAVFLRDFSHEHDDELFSHHDVLHCNNTSPPANIAITLKEWMEKATQVDAGKGGHGNSYLHSAVDLGIVLTKHLFDLLGTQDAWNLDDITSDNLVIFVKPGPLEAKKLRMDEIENVTIRVEDALPLVSVLEHSNKDDAVNSPVDPRQVCSRLGDILLEIFSKGKSCSQEVSLADLGENLLCHGGSNEHDVTMPSMAKRMASVALTSSDSMSDKAKSSLVEMGAPLSILQLVCDLLDTVNETPPPKTSSHITLEQALWDLNQMKNNPQMFLYDRTSPEEALHDAHLFDDAGEQLFGRTKEMDALRRAKNNIMQHCSMGSDGFLFEAAFLSGYAGSGKSHLLRSLINVCESENWFVLKCKFDSKSAPLRVLADAFDGFFERLGQLAEDSSQCDPSILESFHELCRAILSVFDDEAFSQLCGMIPSLSRIFPQKTGSGSIQDLSSMGAAGAAENRLVYLINVLIKAMCSAGWPVLVALDDLQWSDDNVMKALSDFVTNNDDLETSGRQGLLVVGSYRSNEVKEDSDLLENINFIKNSGKSNVTMLNVDGLSEGDITQLISAKLGLPLRYTLELAKLVHRKTKGNPFFVIQFLRTIIHNKMLQFSVRERKWTWDCDTIDLQMISDGVAELLTATFDRLSAQLLQTLKIISLFGNHIHVLTVDQMNSGQQVLSFDMDPQLELAVKEGLMEKAGPFYAFSHDLIHQTLYNLMPGANRRLLHKTVGKSLLGSTDDDNHAMHLLAVDQINVYLKEGEGGELSHEERLEYAKANAMAAEFSVAASSFDKARSYVDMGIQLLQPGHWEEQYSLSLALYEMSASLCYMCGDTTKMSGRLDELLAHAKTFEDSLNTAAMLARLLTSSHKHHDAITNCLAILAQLGEEFPAQPDLTTVQNELSEIRQLLLALTADQMKSLPKMRDTSKLQAMKFLRMLCEISVMAAPMFLPLLSARMMKLTLQHGFCIDSIVGISTTAISLFLFSDDVPLSYQVSKVGACLREESPQKHLLRSRLCLLMEGNIKFMIEPTQAVVAEYPSILESAMLVGDVASAMMCRYTMCIGSLFVGEDLAQASNRFALCMQQSAKYQQHVTLNIAMAWFRVLVHLSGQDDTGLKSFDELLMIGIESNNVYLLSNVIVSQMSAHFWFRDYTSILKLCEKHPAPAAKRVLVIFRCFWEGVAALNLARQQQIETKYRESGEKAVRDMAKLVHINKWAWENKFLLLQAELHYLNKDYMAAEDAYLASIKSAKDHKFVHEEAMANELFGIFCFENQMCDKGTKHLCIALDLYKQWGAMNKANSLQHFIESKVGRN